MKRQDSVRAAKAKLRAEARSRVRTLGEGGRRERSSLVVARLRELPEVERASAVLIYRALPDEPDVDAFLELGDDRAVYAPRVDDAELRFVRVSRATAWVRSRFGPLEPDGGAGLGREGFGDSPVAIVPGVAFDGRGGRLGRGGGHYDRALGTTPLGGLVFAVGAAFDCQIVDEVPREAHDVSLDALVTDRRTVRPR